MGDEGPSVKRAYKTVTWIIPMRVATIGRILYADNATCAIKSLARTNNMKYLQGQAVAPPELKNVGSEPNSDRRDRLHYLADMVRELSYNRASSVKKALLETYKFNPDKFKVVGNGWDNPLPGLNDSSNSENNKKNRRVEIKVFRLED